VTKLFLGLDETLPSRIWLVGCGLETLVQCIEVQCKIFKKHERLASQVISASCGHSCLFHS